MDAVVAADRAAAPWTGLGRAGRAAALRAVVDGLDGAAEDLVPIAIRESHLGEPRLRGELARTTFQLRLLAEVLEEVAEGADPLAPSVLATTVTALVDDGEVLQDLTAVLATKAGRLLWMVDGKLEP